MWELLIQGCRVLLQRVLLYGAEFLTNKGNYLLAKITFLLQKCQKDANITIKREKAKKKTSAMTGTT